tara:strand:- start:888 stop:1019 length:132 start_codon:yes stop_codon:yes gene_type:complete
VIGNIYSLGINLSGTADVNEILEVNSYDVISIYNTNDKGASSN